MSSMLKRLSEGQEWRQSISMIEVNSDQPYRLVYEFLFFQVRVGCVAPMAR